MNIDVDAIVKLVYEDVKNGLRAKVDNELYLGGSKFNIRPYLRYIFLNRYPVYLKLPRDEKGFLFLPDGDIIYQPMKWCYEKDIKCCVIRNVTDPKEKGEYIFYFRKQHQATMFKLVWG